MKEKKEGKTKIVIQKYTNLNIEVLNPKLSTAYTDP